MGKSFAIFAGVRISAMEAGRLQEAVRVEGKKDGLFVGRQKLRVAESRKQRRRGFRRGGLYVGGQGSPSA